MHGSDSAHPEAVYQVVEGLDQAVDDNGGGEIDKYPVHAAFEDELRPILCHCLRPPCVFGYGHYITDFGPGTAETPWVSPLFLFEPAGEKDFGYTHQPRKAHQGTEGGAEKGCEPD